MFSKRASYTLSKNPLTVSLENRQKEGLPVVDLTVTNPTQVGLRYPEQEILAALSDPKGLVYDPAPLGLAHAREAVAAYYLERGQLVKPDQVVMTASTSEAYSFLFQLLADPGGELLVPRPSYPLFDYLAQLSALTTVQYPLVYEGAWHPDIDALNALVNSRSRALVFVSPNNPTGSVLQAAEGMSLAQTCLTRRIPLIWDEVFHDYVFDAPTSCFHPLDRPDLPAFILNGLSKTVALPQVKLGWIVVNGPSTFRDAAMERLEIIADTFLSVSAQVQHAAPRLLSLRTSIRRQLLHRLQDNLGTLRSTLYGSSANTLHLQGGWSAVIQLPRTKTEDEWVVDLLNSGGTLVHPGYFYDFEQEAFVIVSLLSANETFRKGILELRALVDPAIPPILSQRS